MCILSFASVNIRRLFMNLLKINDKTFAKIVNNWKQGAQNALDHGITVSKVLTF